MIHFKLLYLFYITPYNLIADNKHAVPKKNGITLKSNDDFTLSVLAKKDTETKNSPVVNTVALINISISNS